MGSRFFSHHADFAPAAECWGGHWTEAISILAVASAELRLEAANWDRSQDRSGGYVDTSPWRDLIQRAEHLDELAHWLRDNTSLPVREDPQ